MEKGNFIKKFNPVWFATVLGFGGIVLSSVLTAKFFGPLWLNSFAIFLVYFNLLGTGLWLFIILCLLTYHCIRRIKLPYGEGWWAFVFPTASVSIASLTYAILAKQLFAGLSFISF